ncbi:MAG: cytochrome c biogenesis protein CcsA [Spiribacter sp.]|jgi:ABC-type uncharacterized transport system permease subunit|nr:cytochrome c biogenesis protein CcsA [Spiribacter sp.]MDR9488992.1 cytochrome c biogenesis protein CcsA [Spiribacter sp.]
MTHSLLNLAAAISYAGAMAALITGLSGKLSIHRSERLSTLLGAIAVIFHGIALWQGVWTLNGANLALFNAVSLLGWLMALMVIIATLSRPVQSLGLVVFPLAALGMIGAGLMGVPSGNLVPIGEPVDIHVITSILAYAVLGLAATQALMLAWQERTLRRRQAGAVIGLLPPLQNMEALLFQLVGSGFSLLSISLLTGWLFVSDLLAQDLVHKTTLSILAWLVFGGLLAGRYRYGWRGRTAIRWTLSGFALLALAYFGSKVALELILGR